MATSDVDDLAQHPEIFVGKIPTTATAEVVQRALKDHDVEVERLRIIAKRKKPGRSQYYFGFARLCRPEDLQNALAFKNSIQVYGHSLNINRSYKTQDLNIPIGDPENLAIMRLRSFSLGLCTSPRKGHFLESWKEQPVSGAKCTVNFQKSLMHVCFRPSQYNIQGYDYKLRLHFRDLLTVVDVPKGRVYIFEEQCSALIFRFQCAPEMYRQDRFDGESKGKHFWVRGDIEEERDWRRTTVTFCSDQQTLGKYFDYLLVIPEDQTDVKHKLVDRLLKRSDWGYGADEYHVKYEAELPMVKELAAVSSESDQQVLVKGIPFSLAFLIEKMVGEGIIFHDLLDRGFYDSIRSVVANADGVIRIRRALEHFRAKNVVMDRPTEQLEEGLWLVELNKDEGRSLVQQEEKRKVDQSSTHFPIYRVTIRPLTHYCWGPELDTPNRVLRQYSHLADRFLRVHFTDENWERLSKSGADQQAMTELLNGVNKRLEQGLWIGDRHFEFLAVSNSQLREHSCWFFASDGETTANDIRRWMGDFTGIDIVAKYAARMGQCFSSTTTSGNLTVGPDEMEEVADIIKITADGKAYNFSDGIGMISLEFAREAANSLGMESMPSAYQIRFAGCKGVVALDPTMPPHLKLQLRKSMRKFESSHLKLEVVRAATYQLGHLNREIILLLSALGIKDEVFLALQRRMISEFDRAIVEDKLAKIQLMDRSDQVGQRLLQMLNSGFSVQSEPFLQAMLLAQRKNSLKQLEDKTHIACQQSACLMGVLDESGYLKYGQVLLQIRRSDEKDCRLEPIRGNVAITKNPCLHPGDLRVLEAVDPGALPKHHRLHKMVNCVVFPNNGPRPHPDECSGSDLDGDLYFVTWNPDLVPDLKEVVEPMDYSPALPERAASGCVTMSDICKFIIKYMQNDQLGQICNWHMANADLSPLGVKDPICMGLAKQASIAVDYPKTGVSAKKKKEWRPRSFPDFMKKFDKLSHRSKKVLGKLFHEVQDVVCAKYGGLSQSLQQSAVPVLMDTLEKHFDPDLVVSGFEAHLQQAKQLKESYDRQMRNIMRKFSTYSEVEVIGGYLIELPRLHRRRRLHDVQGFARDDTEEVRKQYYDEFLSAPPELIESDNAAVRERYYLQKASAWYVVSYHKNYVHWPKKGPRGQKRYPLVSFAWVPLPYLIKIKEAAKQLQRRMMTRQSR